MRRILQPFRFFGILFGMIVFLAHMAVMWVLIRNRWSRTRWAHRKMKWYARYGLWVLGVRVNVLGLERALASGNGLYVGNHLSYIDVLVFVSRIPAGFVTSMEIRETPVLGQLCVMAGCSFVERRNKVNIQNEVRDISDTLREGLNVAIFPESTSTNGEQILRFRRPLYTAAIDSGRPVIPFCLNYHTVGGEPINRQSADTVFWYGDMGFPGHLWAFSGNGGTLMDLVFLEPIVVGATDDAAALAERSQKMVESVFVPVRKDDGV